jgi:Transposase DDE domain
VDLLLNSTVLQQHEDRILSRRCPAGFRFDQAGGAHSSPLATSGHGGPTVAGFLDAVHRVRNDRAARSKLIGGDTAGDDARHARHGKPRKDGRPSESQRDGLRAAMRARLDSAQGKAGYGLRSQTIEPVFGRLKTVQGAQRFMRRGLAACEAEWKLLCSTHNLLKLWRRTRR